MDDDTISRFLNCDVSIVKNKSIAVMNGNVLPTPIDLPGVSISLVNNSNNATTSSSSVKLKLFDPQLAVAELNFLQRKIKTSRSWEDIVKLIYLSLSAGDIYLAKDLYNDLVISDSIADSEESRIKSHEKKFVLAMIDFYDADGKTSELLGKAREAFQELQIADHTSTVGIVAANNLSVACLHDEKVQMAVDVLESVIKLNPSDSIKNTILVFNLCRLYDFSKPTVEAVKLKQILKRIGIIFAHVDLGNGVLCISS